MVAKITKAVPAEGHSGHALVCSRASVLRSIYDRTKCVVQWPPWAATAYYGGSSNPDARIHRISCFLLLNSNLFCLLFT